MSGPSLNVAVQTGLLIIDMINPFTFPDAGKLLSGALNAATQIATLQGRARLARVPTIYVNDHFGRWRHDFRHLVGQCLESSCTGRHVVQLLRPHEEDYFILKPKHSGFYATPLELLLDELQIRRLILTGIAGDSCVLYTAADAYMRRFALCVPADCTASLDETGNSLALEHMKTNLKVDIRHSRDLDLTRDLQGAMRDGPLGL